MEKPDYCTNSECADCWDCPLMSRGKDCHGKGIFQRSGGLAKSEAKTNAARANGAKGGRPPKKKEK